MRGGGNGLIADNIDATNTRMYVDVIAPLETYIFFSQHGTDQAGFERVN